jgi:hypothetical protein
MGIRNTLFARPRYAEVVHADCGIISGYNYKSHSTRRDF